MTAWEEYKKKIGDARPWHLLNPNNYVNDETSEKRLDICEQCPELIKVTSQCKKCGCFMKLKVKIERSECPLGKW